MIFPICGPHNIGKTITALRIQKAWYLNGIKSLYLNIKYYFFEPLKDLNKKIDTLIKECFYFVENENQLIDLYNEFQKENSIEKIIMFLQKSLKCEQNIFLRRFLCKFTKPVRRRFRRVVHGLFIAFGRHRAYNNTILYGAKGVNNDEKDKNRRTLPVFERSAAVYGVGDAGVGSRGAAAVSGDGIRLRDGDGMRQKCVRQNHSPRKGNR